MRQRHLELLYDNRHLLNVIKEDMARFKSSLENYQEMVFWRQRVSEDCIRSARLSLREADRKTRPLG